MEWNEMEWNESPKTVSGDFPLFRRGGFVEWLPRVWRDEDTYEISQIVEMKTSYKKSSQSCHLRVLKRNDAREVTERAGL
jgi:hypothetical protein